MNATSTLRPRAFIVLLFLFLPGFLFKAGAQISLVRWDMQGLGPTVTPTTNLAMNNGKLVSAVGQGSNAFVTSDGCNVTNQIFLCNDWNNGIGTSYYLINFSTSNYATNTIQFTLTVLSTFGPRNFQAQYSTGSATGPWTDIGSAMALTGNVPNCGIPTSPLISLPAACNNQANVWVRIYTTDNITITSWTAGPSLDAVEVKGLAMTAASITSQPQNSTICEGADATFTVGANNGISYQWQFRTSGAGTFGNVPSNATYDGETTSQLTVNNVTAAMTGYQYRCVVTGGIPPDATSNAATLTVNAYGTWNGSVNTNWDNASNWNCGQVPTATTNVTINSGGNQPIINVNNATCNNLTINSGATLSFSGTTNQLDVKGTASGSGTLNGANGKVIFSGTTAQNILGGTYKDLQMNGTGGKTLAGNAIINGVLTLTSGTLTLGSNNLTISNTGSIASGASSASFIVTNGTGALINQNIGSGGKTGSINFPVGATTTSYTPLVLNNNSGTADNFTVQAKDGVFNSYSGTTGSGALTTNAVNKTWFITEGTAGGSNATVQLTWNGSNELPGFDRDNCKVSHYTGGSWAAGPLTSAIGADPYTASRSGVTSFSPFGVGSTGSPLPLDLLAFNGKRSQEGTLLYWTTAREQGVSSFGIERSADGYHFEQVGAVPSQHLEGTSDYTFTDAGAKQLSGTLYYRLRIKDQDGGGKYSDVIRIDVQNGNTLQVYPNPVGDVLNVPVDRNTAWQFTISDLDGRIVLRQSAAAGRNGDVIRVPVKGLSPGCYILDARSAENVSAGKVKFLKQ